MKAKTDAVSEQAVDAKTQETVDLNSLDIVAAAGAGAEIAILHPVTGKELGITITVIGADSERYRKNLRSLASGRLNRKNRKPMDVEEAEEEGLDLLAKATLGWKGVVVDGAEIPFSKDEAKKLYRRFPWVKEQVDAAIVDRGNFLGD